MKIQRNINNILLALLICSSFSYKNIDPLNCNKYVINKNVRYYTDSLEINFIADHQINADEVNVIFCTQGQLENVVHISISDSVAVLSDYFFRDGSFILNKKNTFTCTLTEKLKELQGYYQYNGCYNISNNYSKRLCLYVNGKIQFKVMFEAVPYSNNHLSSNDELDSIISLIKMGSG